MAIDTDFAILYHILGLAPGCGVDELRRAYRRTVRTLHPDRTHGHLDELERLNALYVAALDFHRRHQRLPGALPAGLPRHADRYTPAHTVTAAFSPPINDGPTGTHLSLIALLLGALFAALTWGLAIEQGPAATTTPSAATAAPATLAAASLQLAPGMNGDLVRRIEGLPIRAKADHWDYGPSWVAFHCDAVSGWYSSPLRPLHVRRDRLDPPTTPPRCDAPSTPD
ncbi:MAG TPA: DnaJ domain-containing protein [Rhodanobacteraceae bacterium]|nr:DnaJ domain-containing protein [Rhodanobacteraceae bacterium]